MFPDANRDNNRVEALSTWHVLKSSRFHPKGRLGVQPRGRLSSALPGPAVRVLPLSNSALSVFGLRCLDSLPGGLPGLIGGRTDAGSIYKKLFFQEPINIVDIGSIGAGRVKCSRRGFLPKVDRKLAASVNFNTTKRHA